MLSLELPEVTDFGYMLTLERQRCRIRPPPPGIILMGMAFYQGQPCTFDICTTPSPVCKIIVLLCDRSPEWAIPRLLSRHASAEF